ncbi:MAG: RnfABCDGE type electron transport complex subunit D, partial [Lutibacter sp.]|nr:RnfABCDGE type electron transport complex subunit D [Lutibacter sp.]
MGLKEKLHNIKENGKDKKWLPAFSAFHTFLYTPNDTTQSGGHVKGADDLKRTMNTVVLALIPCLIFGIFNTGFQHY